MKNVKFLAIALVLSMVLMGTGYAYWQDSIDYQAQVNTGTLNVKPVSGSTHPTTGLYGVMNVAVTNDDLLKYTITNTYPGVVSEAGLWFKNIGTIPAVIESAQVTWLGDAFALNQMQASFDPAKANSWFPLADLDDQLMTVGNNVVLQPGDVEQSVLPFGTIFYRVDPKATVVDNTAQGRTETFNLNIKFKQN